MRETTKELDLDGKRYQLRKMTPLVGSWISNVLISSSISASSGSGSGESSEEFNKLSPQDKAEAAVNALWLVAASRLSEDNYTKIQRYCLLVCSQYIQGGGAAVPIFREDGKFALEQEPAVVNRLILEALQFNIVPFFVVGPSNGAGRQESASNLASQKK